MSDNPCRCLFFHPHTKEGREQIKENLKYFKKIGDEDGVFIMEQQLKPCRLQEKEKG